MTEYLPTTAEQFSERARAGAAWMDKHCPGWAALINPVVLDMSNPYACIWGQTESCLAPNGNDGLSGFENVRRWVREAGLDGAKYQDESTDFIVDHGFDLTFGFTGLGAGREQYAMLQCAWLSEIAARRTVS
jgi:hypothetical protein